MRVGRGSLVSYARQQIAEQAVDEDERARSGPGLWGVQSRHPVPHAPNHVAHRTLFFYFPADLEQHAFSLDQQAEAFAEQALLSKRGQGPRNVPAARH